jgi:transcriptional regulator GlxA family with amidase domain
MDPRLQIVIKSMKEQCHREISLSELAASVNLSLSRLHHLFKAEVGTTPAHYLHSLRMERAEELLKFTLLTVKQILVRVGMNDRSHFDRDFKRIYGLTPMQYRVNAKNDSLQDINPDSRNRQ